jgi:hypothetical protein
VEAALLILAGWLESAGISLWIRQVPWAYPATNTLHLLGLVMLVGSIGVVDLRVLGLWRQLPIGALSAALTPIAVAGLVLQGVTGLALFAADAEALAGSDIFQVKLALVSLALLNAAAFRLVWRGDQATARPLARLSAGASLGMWLAVGALGRLIAYY